MRVAEIGRPARQNGGRIFGNHKPECLKRSYLRYSGSEKERATLGERGPQNQNDEPAVRLGPAYRTSPRVKLPRTSSPEEV